MRASFKDKDGQVYELYGVPGAQKENGEIFVQTQDGINRALPPVRLSNQQRYSLLQDLAEYQKGGQRFSVKEHVEVEEEEEIEYQDG